MNISNIFAKKINKPEIRFRYFHLLIGKNHSIINSSNQDRKSFILSNKIFFKIVKNFFSCFEFILSIFQLFGSFFHGMICFAVPNLGIGYTHFRNSNILSNCFGQSATSFKATCSTVNFLIIITLYYII